MSKQNDKLFKKIYPSFSYYMNIPRKTYIKYKNFTTSLKKQLPISNIIPDCYEVCNTTTINSNFDLNILEGSLPTDIIGNMYICQCLGTPEAFMVGDTNIVKINFSNGKANLKNQLMWNPASIAKTYLQNSKHKFTHLGLMFMSPGLGIFSYMEGMYLLPDGRLGITSDVDRPSIIDRENLKFQGTIGKRSEWIPMMSDKAGEVMGELFSGYSNSHVIYTDTITNELFLANFQPKQADSSHPCNLIKWDGKNDLKKWSVVDETGKDIEIIQSIHELIFTKDYILLADTAFVAGAEIITPWKNAPLPNDKTIVYIINRNDLVDANSSVVAKKIEIDEACIHLIADYENPDDILTVYMLHTPATNTAEIIKSYDTNLNNKRFPKQLIGYGTLPVLDISSLGKHTIDMKENKVLNSKYIRDDKYCWGPYMYTYMGRQTRELIEQDLFIMFKGFKPDMLPKRIYDAYKDSGSRKIPLNEMLSNDKYHSNNSIARIDKTNFEISDIYEMPDKVLLYTISSMESSTESKNEYILAGVVRDCKDNEKTSGHEYWIFDAKNLSAGPICKLGHKTLNNSVLFHTLYLTDNQENQLNKKEISYNFDLKQDYPLQELDKWNPEVRKMFEDIIYPYFDKSLNHKDLELNLTELAKKRIPMHAGKEYLIGEENITNAPLFANRMIEEANRIFLTTGWKIESDKNGLLVESKPVCGPFENSGVLVTRASRVLKANADKLFQYMTSAEGYAVIDPVSDPSDHSKKPLEVYNWKENSRLEAAVANTNIPMLPPTNFVVLNAIDSNDRIFASKSIQHPSMPGSSKYGNGGVPQNKKERAINTFVIKIEPISDNECRVLCINYADMVWKTSASMNNFINTKAFFPPLYKRISQAITKLK